MGRGVDTMADKIVFIGAPDLGRLERFMRSTGYCLIKKGERDEENRTVQKGKADDGDP